MTPLCGTIFTLIKMISMWIETYVSLIILNDNKLVKLYHCLFLDLVFEPYVPSQIKDYLFYVQSFYHLGLKIRLTFFNNFKIVKIWLSTNQSFCLLSSGIGSQAEEDFEWKRSASLPRQTLIKNAIKHTTA